MPVESHIALVFTDIEGSTRLWEQDPARMRPAVARHYEITRNVFERHGGTIDTTTGDGALALFVDVIEAVRGAVELQLALSEAAGELGVALRLRCAIHVARDERKGELFFGPEANRAARIMGAAHGGQILVSGAAADALRERLPEGTGLLNCGNVRLRDLASSEHVYQVTHAGLNRDFPPLRGLAATPNNIPLQLTPLIGREQTLAEARELLSNGRLLTLQGAGGIGKTRLALQLAADELEHFPDGAWFVDLSPVTDASLVANTLASVLHAQQDPSQPVMSALKEHLRDRTTLLLLDNCEHLIDAAATVAEQILSAAPHVKIVATSREPLRVAGEINYVVAPLELPPAGSKPALAEVLASEAVRCFVEWARRAQPSFRVTPENAAAVAEICRRLDGIPLALELAAARISALPVTTVAARLSDRFALLTRGARTALPRQQTLRALIAWSYDLLSPREQATFRRLAVFAGSFTLHAAETVASDADVPTHEMIDIVTSLVDKSLVILDQNTGRYRVLDTIRDFARDRAGDGPEAVACRERLIAFAVEWSGRAKDGLVGPDQGSWMKQLDLERDNLLLAQSMCDGIAAGAELGLELSHNIKLYWYKRCELDVGLRLAELALGRLDQNDDARRAQGLFNAGQFCSHMGRYAQARTYLEQSVAIARRIEDQKRVAAALLPLALAALGGGDIAAAERWSIEALALTRATDSKREVASAASLLATVRRLQGDLDGARALYDELATIGRELRDEEALAIALLNLAIIATDQSDRDRARALLKEASAIVESTASRGLGHSAIEITAALAASAGDNRVAVRFLAAANNLAMQAGAQRDPADEAFLARHMIAARAQLAASELEQAESSALALSYEACFAEVRAYVALTPGSPGSDRSG